MRCLRSLHIIGCICLALLTYWYFILREIAYGSENQSQHSLTNVTILFYSSLIKPVSVIYPSCLLRRMNIKHDLYPSEMLSIKNKSRMAKMEIRVNSLLETIQNHSVVIFHTKDMPNSKVLREVSIRRPERQIWAYYNKESAWNTQNLERKAYDNIFNLTITPRTDSDIVVSHGYYYIKSYQSQPWRVEYEDPEIFEKPHDISIEAEKDLEQMNLGFKERDLSIAWIASNCDTQRDALIGSLLRHLPIHIYGRCGAKYGQNRVCEPNTIDCELLLRRYKFILAFENSLCNDYVSEKYHNALFRGSIPVVYGGSNYDEKVAIPGSYIDVRKFKSIAELSSHIRKVNIDEEEYNRYFTWRDIYYHDYKPQDRHRLDVVAWKLCEHMRVKDRRPRVYNLSTFYSREVNCPLEMQQQRKYG